MPVTLKKINKKDIEDIIALTPTQEGMLYHYLKDRNSDYYFEQLSLTITGEIDFNCFKQAWDFVVETNEMMRTRFRWDKVKKPVQIILKKYQVQPIFHDFSSRGINENDKLKLIEEIKDKDRKKRFDLNSVPFRVMLCKIHENKYEMIVSNHHILYDGWSNRIILKAFFSSYNDLVRKKSPVKPAGHRYKDYIGWLQRRDRDKQEKYWKSYLTGCRDKSGFSIKKKRKKIAPVETGNSHCKVNFSKAVREKIEIFTGGHKITLACLIYSAWGILLQGYNNSDDVIFGTTVSGRPAAVNGIEDIVGLFINTIPLRVRKNSSGHEKIKDFLYRINKGLGEREAYESTSLVEIKEYGEIGFEEQLFDTIVVIENYPLDNSIFGGNGNFPLSVDSYSMVETTHYDLTVGITLIEDIEVEFTYNEDLFDESIIKKLSRHFVKILEYMLDNPGKELAAIEILSEAEKKKILLEFNDTAADYPKENSLHGIFAQQVERTPDHIALVAPKLQNTKYKLQTNHKLQITNYKQNWNISVTYWELNERSEQLAGLLIEKGTGPDTIVGIMVERSLEMIIGILGILKSGGAYLPIDPGYPEERISYMLADSSAGILLTHKDITPSPSTLTSTSTCQVSPTNLAYVIYTSGSTGKPKGVLVEHRNAVNTVTWFGRHYHLQPGMHVLLMSEYTFDASVDQIFGALLHGAVLSIPTRRLITDIKLLRLWIEKHRVQIINFVPIFLNELLGSGERLKSIRLVISGAEALSETVKTRIMDKGYTLYNQYGPTETTIDALCGRCTREKVTLGKPIANVRVFILDNLRRFLPVGVPGELFITGEGVARGYLNKPELTCEKFDHDLWDYQDENNKKFLPGGPGGAVFTKSAPPGRRRQKIYRSGDLVCWLLNGNIEYLGRIDSQLKLRGYRIELGEIENTLLKHDGIKDAVVVARQGEENKYLCAYIAPDIQLSREELREYLAGNLPDYMIPSFFVFLDKIPLTSSGKVDRKALPAHGIKPEGAYIAPRSRTEKKLQDIWSEVLLISRGAISIDGNFFKLGGHSLKAVRLISAIQKELNVEVPLEEIFKLPTIRKLAGYIRGLAEEKYATIEAVEEKEYYALSSEQRRLYFLQEIDENATAYNMPSVWLIQGVVDKKRLEGALEKLIQRHESLRTSIKVIDQEPVQVVHNEVEFEIEYDRSLVNGQWSLVNCQGRGEVPSPDKVEKIIRDFIRPFDLSRAPLLRGKLIKQGEQRFLFMVDMHHIISDGISVEILLKEFMAFWQGEKLPAINLRYRDYSGWQKHRKQKEKIKRQEAYWLKQFAGEIPVLDLPGDYTRPSMQDFAGHTIHFEIEKEEAHALKSLAQDREVTLFMLLLSIYNIFLSGLSRQEDIVVGTPVAGRRRPGLQPLIGMFVNTLAMRNFPIGPKSFSLFLGEVRESTIKAFENQDYLYEDLVELVEVARDTGRNPLFDSVFVLQNMDSSTFQIPGLKIAPYHYENRISKFDLTLTAVELEDRLAFTFEYCTHLFKKETIRRFTGFFKKIVAFVLENDEAGISGIEIITSGEKKRILLDFNDTGTKYPREKTIHQLFAEQVERTPDHTALLGPGHDARQRNYRPHWSNMSYISITYRHLNQKSHQLTDWLKQKGVGADIIVGLMVERSIQMITGILGILKAGAAYLPIDPEYPEERKTYMLKDSNAKILLTGQEIAGLSSPRALYLSEGRHPVFPSSHLPNFPSSLPSSLAYVIYTSGSTGNPKGVAISHANFSPLVHWGYKHLQLGPGHRTLQNLAYYFDWSVWEIFITLTTGACLYPVGKETLLNPGLCIKFMQKQAVTVLHVTPTQYQHFLQPGWKMETLKYLFIGAEKLTYDLAQRSLNSVLPSCRVFNMYGPTEAAIISAVLEIHPEEIGNYRQLSSIPIGKPAANFTLLILDRYLKLCPITIAGELMIQGDGVARGYLNNPELTAGKFDHDLWDLQDYHDEEEPFGQSINACGETNKKETGKRIFHRSHKSHKSYIYKTGDLAKWLPDGNIEFLGRIDHQVKIRGFRIELGEIENHLLNHDEIKDAVVVVKAGKKEEKYLCAYICSGVELGVSELREYLALSLPNYMIPAYFVFLEKIPLTSNGKVDRKALPQPETGAAAAPGTPRDKIEMKLTEIWSEVLGVKQELIGMDAIFFELGGHSLNATVMASIIQKELNVKVTLAQIFRTPHIRGLSGYVKTLIKDTYTPIEPVEKKEYYILSSAQKRLYIAQQMELESTVYNLPGVYPIPGRGDIAKLEKNFNKLINRHESLRTSFHMTADEPVQKVHDEVEFEIEYQDLATECTVNTEEASSRTPHHSSFIIHHSFIVRPFDLSCAPLLRVGLLKTGKKSILLLMDMHHIISDEISHHTLLRDFLALEAGEALAPLRIQYKDYAQWQNLDQTRKTIDRQSGYWHEQLKGDIPEMHLPLDYPRPDTFYFEGNTLTFILDSQQDQALKILAKDENVTLFILLLAIFNVMLAKICRQEDIVVGTVVAGRRHADLRQIIGFFVNQLVIISSPRKEKTFTFFLKEVKNQVLAAFENQDYPLEELLEQLEIKRKPGRHPLFDVVFTLNRVETGNGHQEQTETQREIAGEYSDQNPTAKYDLVLVCLERGESLSFSIEYAARLFKKETIRRYIGYFKEITAAVLQDKHIRLESIQLSSYLVKTDSGPFHQNMEEFEI